MLAAPAQTRAYRTTEPLAGGTTDLASARTTLRAQIARLERRLGGLAYELALPGRSLALPMQPDGRCSEPRLLSLDELELVRDHLLDRIAAAERALARCAETEAAARGRLELMLQRPREHRFQRIYRSELGEPGCGAYQVRPRLGVLGMLFDWWCVKLSSGCP